MKDTKRYVNFFMKVAILLFPELENNEDVCRELAVEMIKKYNANRNCVVAIMFLHDENGVITPLGSIVNQYNLDIGNREVIINPKGVRYSDNYCVEPGWKNGIAYNLPKSIEI